MQGHKLTPPGMGPGVGPCVGYRPATKVFMGIARPADMRFPRWVVQGGVRADEASGSKAFHQVRSEATYRSLQMQLPSYGKTDPRQHELAAGVGF